MVKLFSLKSPDEWATTKQACRDTYVVTCFLPSTIRIYIYIYIYDNNSNEMIKQYKEEKKRPQRTNSSLLHFHFLSIILKRQSQKEFFSLNFFFK